VGNPELGFFYYITSVLFSTFSCVDNWKTQLCEETGIPRPLMRGIYFPTESDKIHRGIIQYKNKQM